MSAVELIKQVRALPERERKRFVLAVLSLEEFDPGDKKTTRRPTKWPDVEARARKVFGDRIVTNLVLLERDESRLQPGVSTSFTSPHLTTAREASRLQWACWCGPRPVSAQETKAIS